MLMDIIEQRFLTQIDEINQLFFEVAETYPDIDTLNLAIHDFLTDMFLEGYAVIGYTLNDRERSADYELIEELLLLNVDGKNLYDRIDEYYEIAKKEKRAEKEGTFDETAATESADMPKIAPESAIKRVLETEGHRLYVEGGYARASDCGAKYKVWRTAEDEKVRDTHTYIADEKVPVDALFYTYDGDSTDKPGNFTLAENNVNCRCWLSYSF